MTCDHSFEVVEQEVSIITVATQTEAGLIIKAIVADWREALDFADPLQDLQVVRHILTVANGDVNSKGHTRQGKIIQRVPMIEVFRDVLVQLMEQLISVGWVIYDQGGVTRSL